MNEISASLARAFKRLDDFQAVQGRASADERLDAVLRLQESVGIGDEARALISERVESTDGRNSPLGHLLLGIIVGLTAAELEAEAGDRRSSEPGGSPRLSS